MTKKQLDQLNQTLLRFQETAEVFQWKQRRPIISMHPRKLLITFIVIDIIFHGVLIYKLFTL